jgi:3-hydroxyisobutyrate dehydrogenase-like beta-hydroxyacid dehydrogenase
VKLLDAPVSGSVSVAEAGQLFAMVGGAQEAYTLAIPVLDAMTKGHVLLGPSGAGAAMKLAVNAMIAVTNEAIGETLVLAGRFGIAREQAYDVLAGGALASPFLLYKRGAFLNPDTEPVAFTTTLMRKDMSLAEDLAAMLGVSLPAAAATSAVLEEAVRSGLAEADMASVMSLLERSTPASLATTSDPTEEQ